MSDGAQHIRDVKASIRSITGISVANTGDGTYRQQLQAECGVSPSDSRANLPRVYSRMLDHLAYLERRVSDMSGGRQSLSCKGCGAPLEIHDHACSYCRLPS